MSHPIILACLKLRGQRFAVKDAMALCGMSHSTVRHRLEGLAVAGVLERRIIKTHLFFHVRDTKRLVRIRDGQEEMPHSTDTRAAPNQVDVTLPLAALFGYIVKQLPGQRHVYHREDEHNYDATPRAGITRCYSSLEVLV